MDIMKVLVWTLPLLFMLHDFEEIILVKAWMGRYAEEKKDSQMKKLPFADFKSTASFSMAVEIEFIVLSIIALMSCVLNRYMLWYGVFFGFVFHFFIHFILCIQFKHYVPGAATSGLFIPPCIFILYLSADSLKMGGKNMIFYCLLGVLLMFLMVIILHKSMKFFENWLIHFEKGRDICR